MKLVTLALAGLAAVAMAATGDVRTTPPAVGYTNDANFQYHCDRDIYITRCAVEGACSTIEECVIRCIDGESGAYCEPVTSAAGEVVATGDGSKKHRSTSDTQHVDEVANALKARYPVPQENKHRECSNDGASVLLCRWGFCTTEYYCKDKKKGSWCHTDCTCCKTGKMGVADVEARAAGVESTAKEVHHARNDAAFGKRQDGYKIGCQIGTTKCSASKSLILSCFNGQKYSPSKACGRGCCNNDSTPGQAFCTCGPSPHGLDSPVTRHAPVGRSPAACRPGSQACNNQYIVLCNGLGTWDILQDCGTKQSCVQTPEGIPFCFGKTTTPPAQVEKRNSGDSSPSVAEIKKREESCNPYLAVDPCNCPGQYKCYYRTLVVCNQAKRWQVSAECRNRGCKEGPNGTAFCVRRDASQLSQPEQPAKRASIDSSPRDTNNPIPSFEYAPENSAEPVGEHDCSIPGFYTCIDNDIYVCDSANNWQLSAHCGATGKCKRPTLGIAFCGAK